MQELDHNSEIIKRDDFSLYVADNSSISLYDFAKVTQSITDLSDSTKSAIFNVLCRYSNKSLQDFIDLGIETFCAATISDQFCSQQRDSDQTVFSINGSAFESATIKTGNVMGVIRLHDKQRCLNIQLMIGSRFDNSKGQYFVNHLLGRVIGGSFVSEIHAGPDSYWEMLLAFLFKKHLQEVARVGLFRQYQHFSNNDLRFRGRLDINRHIRQNIPFLGRLAYNTNEISFDNPLNRLIRHAIKRVTDKWPNFFTGEKALIDLNHELERNTLSWQNRKVNDCIASNQRPVRHPYYQRSYEPIRRVSLRLLRGEGITPYSENDQVSGVLFDGSWLWEEYLWTLLRPIGYDHPDNKKKSGQWRILGEIFYPDFFLSQRNRPKVVLDAKYKRGWREQKDILQVAGYMQLLGANYGGLIKPSGQSSHESFTWDRVPDHNSVWHDVFLDVPTDMANSREFSQAIRKCEADLIKTVSQIG